jgi:aminopeptidase N
MNRRFPRFFPLAGILLLGFLLGACRAKPSPAPTSTPTAPTPTPTASVDALPPSTLFDIDWDDRSPFAPGLISSAQAMLETRPEASVYHMDLTVDDAMTRVNGRLEVRYTNAEEVPLDVILFRLFPNALGGKLTVEGLTLNGQEAAFHVRNEDTVLEMLLDTPLPPGGQVVIGMDFVTQVPVRAGRNYAILAYLDDILALAHFYPMIPAYDDDIGWYDDLPPSYGDVTYSDVAYYLVRVSLPVGQVAQASGVEIAREMQDGRQIVTYAAGPMRDFYLVSSQGYQTLEARVGETTIRALAPAEYAAANEFALDVAVEAMQVFNRYYDTYPFTELDVAATPTLAGGVEYPGVIVIAKTLYQVDEPFFEVATAHEVAHQWFYGIVGNDQVHHPWLDESFTQYNTLLYFKEVHGDQGYQQMRQSLETWWSYADNPDLPLDLPVAEYSEGDYGAIIYGRGGIFFDELRKDMGDEAFEAFQRAYYAAFAWDIATTEGLKQQAEEACGCDLTPMFETWVYPTQ